MIRSTYFQTFIQLCCYAFLSATKAASINVGPVTLTTENDDEFAEMLGSSIRDRRLDVYMEMENGQYMIILGLMMAGTLTFVVLIGYFVWVPA